MKINFTSNLSVYPNVFDAHTSNFLRKWRRKESNDALANTKWFNQKYVHDIEVHVIVFMYKANYIELIVEWIYWINEWFICHKMIQLWKNKIIWLSLEEKLHLFLFLKNQNIYGHRFSKLKFTFFNATNSHSV